MVKGNMHVKVKMRFRVYTGLAISSLLALGFIVSDLSVFQAKSFAESMNMQIISSHCFILNQKLSSSLNSKSVTDAVSALSVEGLDGFIYYPTFRMRQVLQAVFNNAYQNELKLLELKMQLSNKNTIMLGEPLEVKIMKANITTNEMYSIQDFANKFEGQKVLVIGYGKSNREKLSQRVGIGIAVNVIEKAREIADKNFADQLHNKH